MGRFRYHLFACTNDRPAGHPRGSCIARGITPLLDELKELSLLSSVPGSLRINKCGCLDACEEGPVLAIYPDGVYYRVQSSDDVRRIVKEHLEQGKIVSDLQIPNPPEQGAKNR